MVTMTPGSVFGRKILVTGADGFIGSHLVERLVLEGAEVRAFCQYSSQGNHGWLDESPRDLREAVDLRLGDVRDAELVRNMVQGCELVIHLAALIAIPYSYIAPSSFVQTNISGTLNVLEAVRASGARMIHTSTSEVYGTPDSLPIRELHPLRAQSPYAATKIAADKLCESYAASYGVDVATLRPFNTYGPRQSMRAVIPTILVQLLSESEKLQIGALSPRRDFTFVSDTVEGFVRAARFPLPKGLVVQLGTGTSLSIAELVDECRRATGRFDAPVVVESVRERPKGSEVEVLQSDPSLARSMLGWQPSIDIETGIKVTAEWFRGRSTATQTVSGFVI